MVLPGRLYRYGDQVRRQFGHLWDATGLGPVETAFRVAFTTPGVRLRAYGGTHANRPVLLIVPAPIKRPYLWDLRPDVSVVQRCLAAGLQVYMLEWMEPDARMQAFGLAEYADRLIRDCLQVVQAETGRQRVFLAGHSLGGIFAAIFAALYPEQVQGLVLLGTPLHFGDNTGVLSALAALAPRAELLTAQMGNVPGTFLNGASFIASPVTFVGLRRLDWLRSLPDDQARQTMLRVERWSLDEVPLARRLFEEVIEWLYRENRFMRGELLIAGRRVLPEAVQAPLLSVVYADCDIVPPTAVLALPSGGAESHSAGALVPWGYRRFSAAPGHAGRAKCPSDPLAGDYALVAHAERHPDAII